MRFEYVKAICIIVETLTGQRSRFFSLSSLFLAQVKRVNHDETPLITSGPVRLRFVLLQIWFCYGLELG